MTEKTFVLFNDFVNLFLCITYFLTSKIKFQKSVPSNFKNIEYYLYLTLIFCCINELCFYNIINFIGLYFLIPYAFIHQFFLIKYIFSEADKIRKNPIHKTIFLIMLKVQFLTCIGDFFFNSFFKPRLIKILYIF